MNNENITFTATCASGLESLLAGELKSFGAVVRPASSGAIVFSGNLETAYRACLWSRFATRILMPVSEFLSPDTDTLYDNTLNIDWRDHFTPKKTIAVDCTSNGSPIRHSGFAALRVKDAIADQFRARFKKRPTVQTNRPDILIHLYLKDETATISLDLSGQSLHKRGYRAEGGKAPLKESLAASIVTLSGWSKDISSESILLDPMCGSGTLLIEGAFIFGDIAPGLRRDYYGFLNWAGHEKSTWKRLLNEALERKKRGLACKWPRIVGYDADRSIVRTAQENIRRAGLTGLIHIERRETALLRNPLAGIRSRKDRTGIMVVNPPYGERMASYDSARFIYRHLGRKIREGFDGWKLGFFTASPDLADELKMTPVKRHRLYNGPLACQLRIMNVTDSSSEESFSIPGQHPVLKENPTGDFENRLRKNLKRLSKWVKRESISCYRIYDRDIPEYNIAVEIYGKWIHVQEYSPPKTVDADKAIARLKEAVGEIRQLFDIPGDRIFVKVKSRQRGRSQYQKLRNRGKLLEVSEGKCRLLVNLSDYIDTGLFLDHRMTRSIIGEMSKGKRFLNLFGYTGSATVYAAAGGAKNSVTVDLSPVYLEWARCNLALNGFSDENHRLIRADCMDWLSKRKYQFDLIFIDPPTFSNTKKKGKTFDIQKDHVRLITSALARLEPGGTIIFSTNHRRFRIDEEALSGFHLEDISRLTIPPDFERTPKIHRCWKIKRD